MHKNRGIILLLFDNRQNTQTVVYYKYENKRKRGNKIRSILKMLQMENEHKSNFFEKGEDFICESIDKDEKKEDNKV